MLGPLQKIPVISTFKIYKTHLCLFPHIYGLDELPKINTIMHALKYIKNNLDNDLIIPNCSKYGCDDCLMKINDEMRYACYTKISKVNVIHLEPKPIYYALELNSFKKNYQELEVGLSYGHLCAA